MNLSREALEGIERLAREGRVTEGGKAVAGDLAPPALPLEVDEKEFQAAVVALAAREGWLVYHTFDSRRSQPGYPDLTLVRERVLWAELKVPPNRPTAEQQTWIDALKVAGQHAYVFYPEHWPVIRNLLGGVS